MTSSSRPMRLDSGAGGPRRPSLSTDAGEEAYPGVVWATDADRAEAIAGAPRGGTSKRRGVGLRLWLAHLEPAVRIGHAAHRRRARLAPVVLFRLDHPLARHKRAAGPDAGARRRRRMRGRRVPPVARDKRCRPDGADAPRNAGEARRHGPGLGGCGNGGGPLRAITFVVDRQGPRYVGGLSEERTAEVLAVAAGHAGSMADYLYQTVKGLDDLGIHDPHLGACRSWSPNASKRRIPATLRPGKPAREPAATFSPACWAPYPRVGLCGLDQRKRHDLGKLQQAGKRGGEYGVGARPQRRRRCDVVAQRRLGNPQGNR